MSNRPATVALSWFPSEDELTRIRSALPDGVSLNYLDRTMGISRFDCPRDVLAKLIMDADALMGWVQIPASSLSAAAKMKFIAWLHAGCDRLDLELLSRRGIQVSNVRGCNAIPVAEHALALILGLAKRLNMNLNSVREGRWHGWWDPASVSVELDGKTVCIVGYGNIGQALARICKGFGMRILAVRRSTSSDDRGDADVAVGGPDRMRDFFSVADFVILALPLTQDTRGIINEERLSWLRPGCYLINVARGDLVQEHALFTALTSGRLAGFASDVWWQYGEAMPPGHTFPTHSRLGVHRLPNVFATSESASNILMVKDRMIDLGLESLRAFLMNHAIPRLVNAKLGY